MHPSPADLEGLVLGTLLRDEAEQVAEHVEQCPSCEETVRLLEAQPDTYIDALRQPAPAAQFAGEAQCDDFVQLVAAIGDELVSGGTPASPRSEPAKLSQLGQYQLLEKLGDGGMGAVYKAMHVKLKRLVALKLLPEDRLQDAWAVARFEREMEAAGKLQHLNIVAATDAGDHEGKHFLVMEYISGLDAAQLVAHCGRLSVADACEIIRQAALGLACAHQHGLVHRDVKPSNLMLTDEGTVKVLDLGLALLASPQSPGELTSTGQVMGTIDYIAPEQVADAHRVDARADIYGLGATLYKLLTGEPVYHGPQFGGMLQKLRAIATTAAPSILASRGDLPPELAAIVHQLLDLDPARRPQTAEAVASLIAPFTSGANLTALLSHAKNAAQQHSSGSSVHSHLDGTITSPVPPVRPATPEPKRNGAAPAPRRNRAAIIVLVISAITAMLVLPLLCAGAFFFGRIATPIGSLRMLDPSQGHAPTMPLSDPGSLNYSGLSTGDVRYFQVTGMSSGTIWGDDVYTTDSMLATAAVHAGALKTGEVGVVKVTILAGQLTYGGATRNGVTSRTYGPWPRSMRVERANVDTPAATSTTVHDYSGTFYSVSPQAGQTLRFRVTGSEFGSVWGTDVYTTDSNLSAAAVHAGVLKVNETGVVRVTFLPGQVSYSPSTRNGISSSSWGTYSLSYRVARDVVPTTSPQDSE